MDEVGRWVQRMLFLLLLMAGGAVLGVVLGFYGGLFVLCQGGCGEEAGPAPVYIALGFAGICGLCGLAGGYAVGARWVKDRLQQDRGGDRSA